MSCKVKKALYIIPNYTKHEGSLYLLERCLLSIKKFDPDLADVAVVDDHSPFLGTKKALTSLQDVYGFKAIYRMKNGGFSSCVNTGIRFAQDHNYSLVVLCNTDIELLGPVVAPALATIKTYPRIYVLGANLFYPDNRIQHQGFDMREDGRPDIYPAGLYDYETAPVPSGFRYGVTGALMALNLEHTPDVGLFSEAYGMGFEDVEYCQRTWLMGTKVFYDSTIKAIHSESATRSYLIGEQELKSNVQWMKDFSEHKLQRVMEMVARANENKLK